MTAWMPLAGIRVVEACQRLVGPLAGLHLQKMGAEIVKVEPPTGDVARGWGDGSVFDVLNAGKRCVALDLQESGGRRTFASLCAQAAAVLVDSTWSETAVAEAAASVTRSIVVVDDSSVPGGFESSETLAQAAEAVTPYLGVPGERAKRLGADIASASAAAAAVQAALAGLVRDEQGPLVGRVSVDRALSALKTIHWAARSDPDRWAGYHVTATTRQPDNGYRVLDGWVTLDFPPTEKSGWLAFCDEIGLSDFAKNVGDDWFSTVGMEDAIDMARPYYERALAKYKVTEAIEIIRKHRGWSVPFQTVSQMLQHPQSDLYGSIVSAGGQFQTRLPWRVGNNPQGVSAVRAARGIGAHNAEVFAEMLSGASS
jgi:crotonobetainyl-CoA:carnitine CoA-transferase CaiB-like acyl-CoA transferase